MHTPVRHLGWQAKRCPAGVLRAVEYPHTSGAVMLSSRLLEHDSGTLSSESYCQLAVQALCQTTVCVRRNQYVVAMSS